MPSGAIATPLKGRGKGHRPSVLPLLLGTLLLAAAGFLVPVLVAIKLTTSPGVIGPRRVSDLLDHFSRHDFELSAVAAGERAVPRLFLTDLPKDWRGLAQADERKRAFVMAVLPLVLQANERLLAQRARLLAAEAALNADGALSAAERDWLVATAEAYRLDPRHIGNSLTTLKRRLDIVPPSLAVAQAAIESGWGTSRFATEGNALFGQWTDDGDAAIMPAAGDSGGIYGIRRFATLGDSVTSYMRNLNTHRAYRKFRALRAELRGTPGGLDGTKLAEKLGAYSARGADYIRAVQAIIAKNDLAALDRAKLAAHSR